MFEFGSVQNIQRQGCCGDAKRSTQSRAHFLQVCSRVNFTVNASLAVSQPQISAHYHEYHVSSWVVQYTPWTNTAADMTSRTVRHSDWPLTGGQSSRLIDCHVWRTELHLRRRCSFPWCDWVDDPRRRPAKRLNSLAPRACAQARSQYNTAGSVRLPCRQHSNGHSTERVPSTRLIDIIVNCVICQVIRKIPCAWCAAFSFRPCLRREDFIDIPFHKFRNYPAKITYIHPLGHITWWFVGRRSTKHNWEL